MKFLLLLFFCGSVFGQQEFRLRAHKVAMMNNEGFTPSDVKAEIEFGRGLAGRILHLYPLVKDESLQKYVNTLGAGLAAQMGRPELTFYFAVVDSPDVNAYACPGGYVVLTRGLINMLVNEAELVGVLAHEIVHVNERHVIKKLKIRGKDDSAISGLGAMVGGATASFRLAVQTLSNEAMNVLFSEGLQKNEELSADVGALSALYASGYKVSAYRDVLEKIKKSLEANNAKVLAKTHPRVEDRLKLVEKFDAKNPSNNAVTNGERFKLYANH